MKLNTDYRYQRMAKYLLMTIKKILKMSLLLLTTICSFCQKKDMRLICFFDLLFKIRSTFSCIQHQYSCILKLIRRLVKYICV